MSRDIEEQIHDEGVPSAKMNLNDFIEAPCLVLYGELISRRELIKYVSNKLGGAHSDTKRSSTDRSYLAMDKARKDDKIQLAGKPLIYFEMLSIGQALAASDEINAFLKKVG
jgi:hypothetical protein